MAKWVNDKLLFTRSTGDQVKNLNCKIPDRNHAEDVDVPRPNCWHHLLR